MDGYIRASGFVLYPYVFVVSPYGCAEISVTFGNSPLPISITARLLLLHINNSMVKNSRVPLTRKGLFVF